MNRMDDSISRQAAIDALANTKDLVDVTWTDENDNVIDSIEEKRNIIANWLEKVPSAQRWIPCSERLPKKDGRYQVTRYDYVTNTEFIDILWYEENLWWNRHSTGDYAVIAWMPLPEPYQEGEQE